MQEEKKWWKKFSVYQIVAFILTVLLVIGIIVTIAVLVNLKNKTNDLKEKNKEIEGVLGESEKSSTPMSAWQTLYEEQINNLSR